MFIERQGNVKKKEQILLESLKLFARQGYGQTTMKQIGEAVNLNKASLYAHFTKKEEIFKECLKLESYEYFKIINNTLVGKNLKSFAKHLFFNTIEYLSEKDKLLFWKQIYLHACCNVKTEIIESINKVLKDIENQLKQKLKDLPDNSKCDDDAIQKQFHFLIIFMQGFLDLLMLFVSIDENEIKEIYLLFDSFINSIECHSQL